jgi:hypothetical protein
MSSKKTVESIQIILETTPQIYYQFGTYANKGNWYGGNFYGGTFKGYWYNGNYYNSNWEGRNLLSGNALCKMPIQNTAASCNMPPDPVINKTKADKVTKNQYYPWKDGFVKKDTEKI